MLNDSPSFASTADLQQAEPSVFPSSSAESSQKFKFQWPSKKNRQSIPPSTFYSKSHCDTTSKIDGPSDKPLIDADLYRKSKSSLLDASDREYYNKELAKITAKQTAVGGSSLLSALDEDYGVCHIDRTTNQQVDSSSSRTLDTAENDSYEKVTGGSSLLNDLNEDDVDCNMERTVDEQANLQSPQPMDQPNGNVDSFANSDVGDSEQKLDSPEKLVSNEESNEEDVIPCTPPPEKSLKRKAVSNKKQIKITDIYPKLNGN